MRTLYHLFFLATLVCSTTAAHGSGAMRATAHGRTFTATLVELSYAFGEDPPPSQTFLDSQLVQLQGRLGELLPALDAWIAEETKAGALKPVALSLKTALVASPPTTQRSGALSRPALIGMTPCNTALTNLSVLVAVSLTALPSPAERARLGDRLCNALTKAAQSPPSSHFDVLRRIEGEHATVRHALEGGFVVPRPDPLGHAAARDRLLEQARSTTTRSLERWVREHPGTRLVAPDSPGSQTVRFTRHTAVDVYDLFTGVAGAKGDPEKVNLSLQDRLYADWTAAGLPAEAQLDDLLAK